MQRPLKRKSLGMKDLIISVSGLRGIVGESLHPELVMRFATAFSVCLPAGPVVITRDSRASGRMLADAVRSALNAVGRPVVDVGIAATPTTGVLVRGLKAAGGIQISASHNPPQYNGLKLIDANGRVLSASAGEKVVEQCRAGTSPWVDHSRIGQL